MKIVTPDNFATGDKTALDFDRRARLILQAVYVARHTHDNIKTEVYDRPANH